MPAPILLQVLILDITLFRLQCPQFADPVKYPEALVQVYWDMGTAVVSDENYGACSGWNRQAALNLMTAHLMALAPATKTSDQSAFVVTSKIDKIEVTRLAPPNPSQFSWWLNQTPYGSQLLVLLEVSIVGGISIGGLPERSAFRKVGGIF